MSAARSFVRWDRTAFPMIHMHVAAAIRAQECTCMRFLIDGISTVVQWPEGSCPLHPEVTNTVTYARLP